MLVLAVVTGKAHTTSMPSCVWSSPDHGMDDDVGGDDALPSCPILHLPVERRYGAKDRSGKGDIDRMNTIYTIYSEKNDTNDGDSCYSNASPRHFPCMQKSEITRQMSETAGTHVCYPFVSVTIIIYML